MCASSPLAFLSTKGFKLRSCAYTDASRLEAKVHATKLTNVSVAALAHTTAVLLGLNAPELKAHSALWSETSVRLPRTSCPTRNQKAAKDDLEH